MIIATAGCSADDRHGGVAESVATDQQAQHSAPGPTRAHWNVTLPWGSGSADVGRTVGAVEQLVQGPSAIAVHDGRALVLDRINGRIMTVTPHYARALADVAVDAEVLSASPHGIVAFSPVRSTAWVFDAEGSQHGSLRVPRALRELTQLNIQSSRRLVAHTAYQERLALGSPSAPLALPAVLRSKREGVVTLGDGTAVSLQVRAGRAELVHRQAETRSADRAPRNAATARVSIGGEITAGRIVGRSGNTLCLRLEHVTSKAPSFAIAVKRRATCIDALSGAIRFDVALPPTGLYVPRTELAFSGETLAFIHPSERGLSVTTWRVPDREMSVEVTP